MRTFIMTCITSIALSACVGGEEPSTGTADQALELCGTTGDQDGDGIPDYYPNGEEWDVSQTDSCLSDPNGFGLNNITTGAGDGLPDCE
ncbi:MAG: hypothetical protein AAB554_00205 [Patescibacteria group bacterium]